MAFSAPTPCSFRLRCPTSGSPNGGAPQSDRLPRQVDRGRLLRGCAVWCAGQTTKVEHVVSGIDGERTAVHSREQCGGRPRSGAQKGGSTSTCRGGRVQFPYQWVSIPPVLGDALIPDNVKPDDNCTADHLKLGLTPTWLREWTQGCAGGWRARANSPWRVSPAGKCVIMKDGGRWPRLRCSTARLPAEDVHFGGAVDFFPLRSEAQRV